MNRYIVVKDNQILRVYHTKEGIESIHKIMNKYNVKDYQVLEIPENNEYASGYDIREFEEHKLKSEERRIIEGLSPLPEGMKVKDGKLVKENFIDKVKGILK